MIKNVLKILVILIIIISVIFLYIIFKDRKVTDYSKVTSWVISGNIKNKDFDVFFVHPTTYLELKNGLNDNLNDEKANRFADMIVERLTGVFSDTCNVYAPRYQQASIAILGLPIPLRHRFLDIAAKDVEEAFKYYLKNFNNGKPYIIAGHSQGTNIIKNIFTKNPDLLDKSKLIAIYAVGYTITEEDINKIGVPLGVTPTQVPSLLTWNTIAEGGKSPTINDNALCINPLDWTNNSLEQDKSKNILANIMLNDGNFLEIKNFTSAKINNKGALVIPKTNIDNKLYMDMGENVYHMYDYDFFYGNFRENVKTRCMKWKEQNK